MTVLISIAIALILVDLALFVDFGFEKDQEPPLPRLDFARMMGVDSKTLVHPTFSRKPAQCHCDALKYPSSRVKCFIGASGEQQTRIKGLGSLRQNKDG